MKSKGQYVVDILVENANSTFGGYDNMRCMVWAGTSGVVLALVNGVWQDVRDNSRRFPPKRRVKQLQDMSFSGLRLNIREYVGFQTWSRVAFHIRHPLAEMVEEGLFAVHILAEDLLEHEV